MLSRRSLLTSTATILGLSAAPFCAWARDDKPFVSLSFNTDAVRQLLDLQAAKDTSEKALNTLLDLPAYKNILRVGEAEGSVSRERLLESVRAVISGTATLRDQPREDPARQLIVSADNCRNLLKDLDNTTKERTSRIANRLALFTPEKVRKGTPIAQTVYLHFGGTWDALNVNGDIFLNFHYWTEYNRPSLDGLNLVVAHETMHTIQNRAYGNPEAQDDGTGAFLTALSKIQREGTARLVETETDAEPYAPYTYGFFYRAVDNETLRDFARIMPLLGALHDACFPFFNKDRFASLYSRGIDNGGVLYALGYGVAKAIDDHAGRSALIATVEGGPKAFWTRYNDVCRSAPSLPRLPDPVIDRLKELPERLTEPGSNP